MPPSSTSRLPVEIWQRILRFVILGLYILNPDPYDVPSSLLLNIPLNTDMPKESYEDYMVQVENLRLVCKSWNSFALSLLDLVVSLRERTYYPQNIATPEAKRIYRAIKITQRYYPPNCECRFGQSCLMPSCSLALGHLKQIHPIGKPFQAQIMDVINYDILQLLVDSSECFPNLISVNLDNMKFLPSILPTFFARFSTLVLLRIQVYGYHSARIPLDLPKLRSLEIWVIGALTFQGWKLPSLRHYTHEIGPPNIEDLTNSFKDIAPNLTFLSLPYGSSFNPSRPSDIWEKLPSLIILSCPIDFLLSNLPPSSHPFQQFRMFKGTGYDIPSNIQQRQILKAKEDGSNLRSIMANFDWSEDFEWVIARSRDAEPLRSASERRSRLSFGLELQHLGVKYHDMYGIDFTGACGRFGGDSPKLSIQEYVSSITAREQKRSPSDFQ